MASEEQGSAASKNAMKAEAGSRLEMAGRSKMGKAELKRAVGKARG